MVKSKTSNSAAQNGPENGVYDSRFPIPDSRAAASGGKLAISQRGVTCTAASACSPASVSYTHLTLPTSDLV